MTYGYGYGGRGFLDPTTLPEYYGPSGDDIAQAFIHRDERQRRDRQDKLAADEHNLRMREGEYRLKHQQDTDPLEDAMKRAHAAAEGILLPGQGDQAQPPQPPMRRVGDTLVPGQPQQDVYDMSPVQGTAHALPGSFNPVTGVHNPSDVDLGGGYRMPYNMTREGAMRADSSDLGGFGFNPQQAGYLSRHPEHIAPFMDDKRSGYRPQTYDEAVRFYRATHPRWEWDANGPQPQGGLTMQQALIEARTMAAAQDAERMGNDEAYQGPLAGRDYMRAQQMYFGPGGAGYNTGAPRGRRPEPIPNARPGQRRPEPIPNAGPVQGRPVPLPNAQPGGGDDRSAQLQQIRGMIPKNASPAHVRAVLRKHGLSDTEINQVLGQR